MKIGSIDRAVLWRELRDYMFITIAMLFYCIGWTVFLLPNNLPVGGVPGIASLIYWAAGVPVQVSYFLINAALLIAALKVLGFKFCVKTIYAVSVLTLMISISQHLMEGVRLLHDQPFMTSVIGAAFCGTGVGLNFASNGSTGGTDIIAAIVNKYHDISLGRVILICDVIIISSSYLVLHSWELVIYGFVVLYIIAYCIDNVINSMRRSVQFFIVTDKYEEIGRRINTEVHRGCTVITGQGFYSGHEVKMLFVLAKKNESDAIFSLINEVDPAAFVSQSAVIGVYGQGFDRFRGKHPKEKSTTTK